ncbi:uncharacterized protein LOC121521661 [Cheilinus undulatus]|uniref:uncharacterized protein LOC121521661 n=1 Tax=Cheilinus undulatus TaxID=241271 RepID=UPI001BD6715C|nr:uncharacterized protein LOC121521661 [Cheilinus undulatus]
MTPLEVIFVVGLLFEVSTCQKEIYSHFHQDVTLHCDSQYQPLQCSRISWLYNRDSSETLGEAIKGTVKKTSRRANRLRLGTDCSLVIKNFSAEDVGLYTCRLDDTTTFDVRMYLSLFKVSPEPADFDPKRDDELSLECSLMRYRDLHSCPSSPLHWVDETGATITEGVERNSRGTDCLSYLKVKRQSGNNKKFTCQVLNKENIVEIEADYTPFLKDPIPDPTQDPGVGPGPSSNSSPDLKLIFIIVGVLVGVVLLLIIMAVVLIKHKKRDKVADVPKPTQQPDDPESNLTYVTVNHSKQQAFSNIRGVNEDAVTYSTVKSAVKMGKDDDPSSLYSTISKN